MIREEDFTGEVTIEDEKIESVITEINKDGEVISEEEFTEIVITMKEVITQLRGEIFK